MKQLLLRPSSAARWIACPASARLSLKVPYEESGEAAKIGTAIHALSETCWQLDQDPMDFIGKTIEGIVMTRENAEFALAHIRTVAALEKELGTIKVEQFGVAFSNDLVRVAGTADVVAFNEDKSILEIADLKTGRQWVDADSAQMKIYALGVLKKYLSHSFEIIRLTIVQPQTGDNRTHVMTATELHEWADNVLMPAVNAAVKDTTEPTPSKDACQYCPAKMICPAQTKALAAVPVTADVTTLSPDQVSDLLDKAELVEDFIAALRKQATKTLTDGGVLRGWQMAPKRPTRQWTKEADAVKVLREMNILEVDIYQTSIITPAAADKLLGKDRKQVLDSVTTKVSSGLTLSKSRGLGESTAL
jgi:CRISPR/Cas system-associated exonuclease Cas4 (RecB family)